ncbi:hypothetical protein SAMN04488096_101110 [Mesonia phycicola]|uniref:Uncharacterized protein n=1 Tax=Mesonia phycicola TaxID=579105 RepID=A0A1M6A6Y3_9FLAO|nr:hypothetical protein [Mesonia phycicola]SHI32206.1 hypothetical protein SAMN04488096_101110 [Mesonia phycicola]
MKKHILYLFTCCLLLNSCQESSVNYDWLVGNWTRTNGKKIEQTYEYWQRVTSEKYKGLGFTLVENDTVFKEELTLLKVNEDWVLRVEGVNEEAVDFLVTKTNVESFSAENKENEFPKVISYQLDQDLLKATISDDKNSIDFVFKQEE